MAENSTNDSTVSLAAETPASTSRPDMGEVGATGTEFFHGFVKNEEYNAKLQGQAANDVFTRMQSDAQVYAGSSAVELPIKSANWEIEAEDDQVKADLNEQFFTRLDFPTVLDHSLLAPVFGHEVMEKNWEVDEGKFWYESLAHRAQSTIRQWHTDKRGRLSGITQAAYNDGVHQQVFIPADKLFHLSFRMKGNNFVGQSLLRSAYKYWFIKENIEKIAAIAIERFGLGVPGIESPREYNDEDYKQGKKIAMNYRAGSKAWFFLPDGWKLNLSGQGDASRYDPMPMIRYCDEMIATSVLAMFLYIGRTSAGTYNAGKNLLDVFQLSLQSTANWLMGALNTQLVRPFLLYNYPNGDQIKAGFRWSDLEIHSIESVAVALERLARGGFYEADEETQDWVRTLLKAPQRVKTEVTKARDPAPSSQKLSVAEYWRELTEPEKSLSLKEIDGKQDDGEAQVAEVASQVKGIWVDELIAQIRAALADGDASDVADIEIPKALRREKASELVTIQRDLFRFGKRMVQEEKVRQRRREKLNRGQEATYEPFQLRDDAPENDEITNRFWARSRTYLDKLASVMGAIAIEMAQGLHRTQQADFDAEDLGEIENDLLGMLGATAALEARVLVAEAFNLGRDRQAQALIDEIDRSEYSAILDEITCQVCRDDDGDTYVVGSKEYYAHLPPNPRCHSRRSGANKCRCLIVYVFKSEGA